MRSSVSSLLHTVMRTAIDDILDNSYCKIHTYRNTKLYHCYFDYKLVIVEL